MDVVVGGLHVPTVVSCSILLVLVEMLLNFDRFGMSNSVVVSVVVIGSYWCMCAWAWMWCLFLLATCVSSRLVLVGLGIVLCVGLRVCTRPLNAATTFFGG